MNKKRGNITVYIILGIIILLVGGILGYIYFYKTTSEMESGISQVSHFSSSALKIKPFVTECIRQQAVIALFEAANRGEFLSKQELKDVVATHLTTNLRDQCGDFTDFKEFEIIPGKPLVEVLVKAENFEVKLDWSIEIKQGDLSIKEKDFLITFSINLDDLYQKIEDIVKNNKTLDLDFILGKKLDIEILGCEQEKIRYVVNDKDYLVDENILPFFFNEKIENLIDVFKFDSKGIKYKVKTFPGMQILRHENDYKKLMFEVKEDSYINNCYGEDDIEEYYYTFSLVEDNEITASIAAKEPKRIDIKKVNSTSYEFSSEFKFLNGTIILKKQSEISADIYHLDEEENLIKVESVNQGEYVYADVNKLGVYTAITSRCMNVNEVNKDLDKTLNIVFVPVEYNDVDKFLNHVGLHANDLLLTLGKTKERINIYTLTELNEIKCKSFDSATCSLDKIKEEVNVCDDHIDLVIALVDNTLVGLDHTTKDGVSYVGSYLTESEKYCNTCLTAHEFGSFVGLNKTVKTGNVAKFIMEIDKDVKNITINDVDFSSGNMEMIKEYFE